MNRLSIPLLVILATLFLSGSSPASDTTSLNPKELLGKHLFFDAKLSVPEGQSCASCHAPEVGFTGPGEEINKAGGVYEGATKGRFGNRKPPTSSYGGDSPVLHFDKKEKAWVGGMFWDGRATGTKLKDPLAEQAQGPFLNPLEQNLPTPKPSAERSRNHPMLPSSNRFGERDRLTATRMFPPRMTGLEKASPPTSDRRRRTPSAQNSITGSRRR